MTSGCGCGLETGTCYIKDSPLKNTSANVHMCACVCVTLAWPGAKVGCPERQCVCSHAFSSRLAGFITATNHWPDKSSYFILPPSSSSSSSPPLLSLSSALCGGFACFTLRPTSLAQSNRPISTFLRVFLIVFTSYTPVQLCPPPLSLFLPLRLHPPSLRCDESVDGG